ncbi:HAD family hydrolase, partial [Streptomyces sp. SAS_267]
MSIDAVVWDIDDTLFDYTSADRAGIRDHLAAEGLLDGGDR